MNDMTPVIVPKSDQINADDLISGPITITIREVRISAGQDQPVSIYFDGSDKAYRPCKSMSRALVYIWGPDAGQYIGRSMTLYRDPKVRFGKDQVGGIRISHMSDIPADKMDDGRVVLMLTATRAQRKPHVIQPLERPAQKTDKAADGVRALIGRIRDANPDEIGDITSDPTVVKQREWLETNRPELARMVDEAVDEARGNPFGKPDDQRGEGWPDDSAAA